MPDEVEGLVEPRGIGKYRDKIVNGPIIRTIFWLGLPPLINQLVIVAYNVADAYWLSSYSEVTVAVPRQAFPVVMLFQALAMALTAASLGIVSQYIGCKAYKQASLEASRFFTAAFLSGSVLSVSLFLLRGVVFSSVVVTPPEIFEDVMKYTGIIAVDVFFNYLALTYTTLLQSVGDTKRPALINVVAVGVNVVLDPFFVLGLGPFPRLGVVGAAVTDVIGKVISVSALTFLLRRSYPELKMVFTRAFDSEWVRLVLRIGLPILTLGLMNGFAFLIQLRMVNALGIVIATAFSIGFVVMEIVDAGLWGLMGAPAIMVGQSLGAGDRKRAREVAWKASLLIFGLMVVGSGVIFPVRNFVVDVFADNPAVLFETDLFLATLLPTLPFFGLIMCAMSIGRGSGHTLFPTGVNIFRLWGVRLGVGYVLAFVLSVGSLGVWLAISLSNIVGGIIAIIWIKYGNWAKAVVKGNSV